MPDKKNTWVFVFSSVASYRLLRYVAELATKERRQVAYLYTGSDTNFYAMVQADADRIGAQAHSIEIELTTSFDDKTRLPDRPIAARCRAFLMRTAMRFVKNPHQALAFKNAFQKRQQVAYVLLKKIYAHLVICCEDGVTGDLSVLSVAQMMKLPVVDIPYGNGTVHELEFDLSRKSDEGRLILAEGVSLLMLRLLCPQWLKKGRFKNALMFTPEMIFAWESLGMSLRDAWIVHGGDSDLLCVENEMSDIQYSIEKIPRKKRVNTGSPYCDMMIDSLHKRNDSIASLRSGERIESGRTRILVSWPPSYHETYPDRSEFQSYDEMTLEVLCHLNNLPDVDLIVSLHPACNHSTRALIENVGIEVSDVYLIDLIPSIDIYITYFSSTIRWALAAGKIVLNYDAYSIGIKAFESAPGFINFSKFHELCLTINSLVTSDDFFKEIKFKQITNSSMWGIMDGQCTRRIFDESEKLLTRSR